MVILHREALCDSDLNPTCHRRMTKILSDVKISSNLSSPDACLFSSIHSLKATFSLYSPRDSCTVIFFSSIKINRQGRGAGNQGPGSQTAGTGKRTPENRNGRAGRRTGPEKQKRRKRNGRDGTGCRLFRPLPPGAAPALRGRCGTATERGRSCAGKSGTDRRPPRNAAGRRYPPRRARCR